MKRHYGSCNITIGTSENGERVDGKFNNTASGRSAMAAAYVHNMREKDVINADTERSRFNHDLINIESFKDEYYRMSREADYKEVKAALRFMDTINKRRTSSGLEPVSITEAEFKKYRDLYRESDSKATTEDRAVYSEYRTIHMNSAWVNGDKDTLLKGLVVDMETKKDHVKTPYELISDYRTSEMKYYNTKKANGQYHPVRKDALIMIQLVLTLTRPMDEHGVPQELPTDFDMKSRERFEQVSLEWTREKFKDPITGKDNVVAATVHYDETSPHIHVLVCPEYDGKYNQHPYIGGKSRWVMLSNEYGNLMAKEFGIRKPIHNIPVKKERHQNFRAMKAVKYDELNIPEFDSSLIDTDGKVKFKDLQEYIDARDEIDKGLIGLHANEMTVYNTKLRELKSQIKAPDKATKEKLSTLESRVEYLERTLDDVNYIISDETQSKTEALQLIESMKSDTSKLSVDNIALLQTILDTEEYQDIVREEKAREAYIRDEADRQKKEQERQKRREKRKKLRRAIIK